MAMLNNQMVCLMVPWFSMVQLLLCIFNVKLWRQDPTSIRLRWPNGRTSVATSSWLFLAHACLKCARAGGSVAPATTVATTSSQPQTWCRWMVATEFFEDFSREVAQPPAIGIDHPPNGSNKNLWIWRSLDFQWWRSADVSGWTGQPELEEDKMIRPTFKSLAKVHMFCQFASPTKNH